MIIIQSLKITTTTQYAHDAILTSERRRFNVMDVVWMSKRCRVLAGSLVQNMITKSVSFNFF